MNPLRTIGDIEEILAPPFTLPTAYDGAPLSLHTFRHREPVGLVFVPLSIDVSSLLSTLRKADSEFRQARVALLVITRQPTRADTPYPVLLVDPDGRAFHRYECPEQAICLFALDRYGAIVWRSTAEQATLAAALRRLLEAIEFSEIACPE